MHGTILADVKLPCLTVGGCLVLVPAVNPSLNSRQDPAGVIFCFILKLFAL